MNEYSTSYIKDVFTLIKDVSPYSLPLFLSLLFPFLWALFKRLLGLTMAQPAANNPVVPTGWFSKLIKGIGSWLSIVSSKPDKIVFAACLFLFVSGTLFLKWAETKEERFRQKGLTLKAYFTKEMRMSIPVSELTVYFREEELENLCLKYPKDFLMVFGMTADTVRRSIMCIDTAVVNRYRNATFPLLIAFVKGQLQRSDSVRISTLFSGSNYLRNNFIDENVYGCLAKHCDKNDLVLDIMSNDEIIIRSKKQKNKDQ